MLLSTHLDVFLQNSGHEVFKRGKSHVNRIGLHAGNYCEIAIYCWRKNERNLNYT